MIKKYLNSILSPNKKREIKKYIHAVYRITHCQKKIQSKLAIERIYEKGKDIFFGYYDITPFDHSDQKLLYIKRDNDENVEVIIRDLNLKSELLIAKSSSWNWQQGCRLRWFSDNEISFNDILNNSYVNRIINIAENSERRIDWPLYDISRDKKYGLSLDFERLGYLRPGYGYSCLSIDPDNLGIDGIDIIDIQHNRIVKRFSIEFLHTLMNSKNSIANCYVNHLSFSPSSNRFLFFWIEIINGYHKASLVVYDMDHDQFTILDNNEKVSHYVWKSDNEIICTAYSSPFECKYYSYIIEEKSKNLILPDLLPNDGHPSILDQDTILTDTYSDKHGFQQLYTVDLKKGRRIDLLNIYSPPVENGEKRTDLHPRINHSKNKICIDARIENNREVLILNLK